MSAWETVPEVDDPDIAAMDEVELEEYLDDVFGGLLEYERLRQAGHNQDGYFAKYAGSDECIALGHTEDDYENDETHPPSWDGDPLCLATRYGTCCTECEGECSYEPVPLIWSKPGVLAT